MKLREIPNPDRNTGRLVEGAFYAIGEFPATELRNSWTWCLGRHLAGEQGSLFATVIPDTAPIIHLPATLNRGKIVASASDVPEVERQTIRDLAQYRHLPAWAMLNHVEKARYTPFGFYTETALYGPARRLTPADAKLIAQHLPLPIVFSHDDLPLIDPEILDDVLEWSGIAAHKTVFNPTHSYKDWGLSQFQNNGGRHWVTAFIRKLNDEGYGKRREHLTRQMPYRLAEDTMFAEQIYGISWVTTVAYIAADTDDDVKLRDVIRHGIEPVRAEKKRAT